MAPTGQSTSIHASFRLLVVIFSPWDISPTASLLQSSWASVLYGAIAGTFSLAETRYGVKVRTSTAGMIDGMTCAGGVIGHFVAGFLADVE